MLRKLPPVIWCCFALSACAIGSDKANFLGRPDGAKVETLLPVTDQAGNVVAQGRGDLYLTSRCHEHIGIMGGQTICGSSLALTDKETGVDVLLNPSTQNTATPGIAPVVTEVAKEVGSAALIGRGLANSGSKSKITDNSRSALTVEGSQAAAGALSVSELMATQKQK